MVGALGYSACPSCSSSADQPSSSSKGPTRKREHNGITNCCSHRGASQGVKGIRRDRSSSAETLSSYIYRAATSKSKVRTICPLWPRDMDSRSKRPRYWSSGMAPRTQAIPFYRSRLPVLRAHGRYRLYSARQRPPSEIVSRSSGYATSRHASSSMKLFTIIVGCAFQTHALEIQIHGCFVSSSGI